MNKLIDAIGSAPFDEIAQVFASLVCVGVFMFGVPLLTVLWLKDLFG